MTRTDYRTSAIAGASLILSLMLGGSANAAGSVDMAKAKEEGKLVWYTSTPVKIAQQLAKMFEAKTGIQVELFRSGGSAIMRRFMQEHQAGRNAADVMTTSDPAASAELAKKGVFVPFKPTDFDKVPDSVKDANGAWIGQRLNMMVMFVLNGKLDKADYPKTWTDAANPKYKGQMAMTDPSFTALQLMVVSTLSRKLGWDYYEKLRKNDIMIVRSNQQVTDTIKRGERAIALGAVDTYATEARMQGHKIDTIYPSDGAFVISSPTAIIKGGPHPNAAKAFAEFMISMDAQKLFPAGGSYGARVDLEPPPGNPKLAEVKVMPIDFAQVAKDSAGVKKKFAEIFQ
jgi:iron(III) transport system substrate-binding protein